MSFEFEKGYYKYKMEKNKVLITGGAGSIGSELVRQLAPMNEVYIIDNNETAFFDLYEEMELAGTPIRGKIGDIRDEKTFDNISKMLGGYPHTVFHCAALKHVTPSEWQPMEYVKTNIIGTQNVINFVNKYATNLYNAMVNISTDKVVNAESIMGITKKIAEKMVKNAGYISVRFGNVMGSRGSVLSIWQKQIDENKPLTVTDQRMERYMMSIPEACNLLIKAAEVGEKGQILVMNMGKQINIVELAEKIIAESGKDVGLRFIGARKGETISEKLMTEEEEKSAIKYDNFWVLQ